jgi:cytochrome P450
LYILFPQYKDLLQLIIDSTEEEEDMKASDAAAKGCPYSARLTEEGIVDVTMDILLAGFDTTANSLCFVTYLLALNPDIQEKLQAEIGGYFEENPVRFFLSKQLPPSFISKTFAN